MPLSFWVGAAWYLAQNWRRLAKRIPADEDFAALVTVPVMAPTSAYLHDADIVQSSSPAALPSPVTHQPASATH